MECLDEETILGFCRGGLTADARALAQEHIGTCDECRVLVSAVARSSFVDTPPNENAPAPDSHPEDREDQAPGPLLRARERLDLGMAPTTPFGAARHEGASRSAVSPVEPGQILAGKFEVERVLGAGGMGIVVAARHTQLDQRVALKFLLPVACEVPGAVARFLREGKAAARITSEHVARVMDTGVLDGGAPYLVMEYLEGSDLGALVQTRGAIPAEDAIEYVLQACEAIVEAHDLGIVHRDLKPANLFLSHRADGSPLVKVLDFGISKVAGGGSRSELLTSASVLMGSPRYMSPEQMLSAKDVDARTDVWALGVILYELVTGKPVWHADTMQGLCALIASAPAPSLLASAPNAPEILDETVARCLAKSRDDRIASVADLALALEPIAPASARTSIERILRVARKGSAGPRSLKSGPPASAAVASARVATIVAADATTNDPRRGSPPRIGIVLAIGVAVLLVAGIALNAALAQRTSVADHATAMPALSAAPAAPAVSAVATSAPSAPPTTASATPLAVDGADSPSVAASSASAARRVPRPTTVPTNTPPQAAQAAAAAVSSAKLVEAPAAPVTATSRALTDRK